jgi:hypothetical protein
MVKRQNLVIVRAGDNSLHREWLKGKGERNWDIVVNYYGDDPEIYREWDVERIDSKGPKWPSLYELISSTANLIAGRSYIWLPDDDLLASKQDINRLFEICAEHKLEVAQPALTWDSYYSHLITLRNCRTTIRFTNFVEIMAPCFFTKMLVKSLPEFRKSLSGWGMDSIWARLADNPVNGIAIIDAITVRHTRPVGGPSYNILREKGVSPWDEHRAIREMHGIDEDPTIATHKVIYRNGKVASAFGRERRFSLSLLLGVLPAVIYTHDRYRIVRRMMGIIWKSLWNLPDKVRDYSRAN